MNLLIVESPTKAKTIKKYLKGDFEVLASFGHVRDLPIKELGIDTKKNFEPSYVIVPRARKVLKNLLDKLKQAKQLYLATDYDREGEAIAWHLVQAFGLAKKTTLKPQRITFHEITQPAIEEALKHPREIDLHLVDAQQARRVLDRLVGYKLSPLLWHKVARGLSAGRVQSVAVRLIVEKEREIEKFKPEEYWTIEATLSKNKVSFQAVLKAKDGQKIAKLAIKEEKEARNILAELENASYQVLAVSYQVKKRFPPPPYTTSTLTQEAGNKLALSAKFTMRLAQNLYEEGLITYMRTDSVSVSPLAMNAARKVIKDKFGANYSLASPRIYKTKTKGAQEAHEAIRPTNLDLTPEKSHLPTLPGKLYDLIWKRMLASQMKEAEILEENVQIGAKNYTFQSTGLQTKFDGFLKLYFINNNQKENILPKLVKGDKLTLEKLEKNQHFTEPPARFTEAALIKELEKRGIGRPSTYAPILGTIIDRGYVEKNQGKLIPKEIGKIVNDLLVEHFPEIVDYNFTARLEEELDEIAEGKSPWRQVVSEFYEPFIRRLKEKSKELSRQEITEEESKEICPQCGQKLKIKLGRFGKFLACSGFPACKYTKPILENLPDEITLSKIKEICPQCGQKLNLKEGKFGPFLACPGYPACKYTKKIQIEAKVKCSSCGGKIIKKNTRKGKTFWGCANFPKCKTAFWDEPKEEE